MSVDSPDQILTYWLIPAEPALSWFRSLIDDLARRLDAPVFEPHVTLYVTKAADENPVGVIATAFANVEPPRLSIAGVDFSDEFTKTLFVQLQPDATLTRLSENLRATSISQLEYELNPHLSLIYKKMPPETKRQIVRSLNLSFTEVRFDSVKAVISPAKIEGPDDVESWRVVATRHLGK